MPRPTAIPPTLSFSPSLAAIIWHMGVPCAARQDHTTGTFPSYSVRGAAARDFKGLTEVNEVAGATIPLREAFAALGYPFRLHYTSRDLILVHIKGWSIVPYRDEAPTVGNDGLYERGAVEMPRAGINENKAGEVQLGELLQIGHSTINERCRVL